MTPITDEWLKSRGWYQPNGFAWTMPRSSAWIAKSQVEGVWNVFVEVYDLGTFTCQEDIVAFEKALHIEIKE